jgi:hypothetical protein
MKASDYVKQHLVWKPHPVKPYYFTHHNSTALLLRKNDGAGKAMYTLSHRLELVQLDHLPKRWKIDQPVSVEPKAKMKA